MATQTWVDVPADSDFPITNLPFGAFSHEGVDVHVGVAIGDRVLDVTALANARLLDGVDAAHVSGPNLDALLAAGRPVWTAVRDAVRAVLTDDSCRDELEPHLHHQSLSTMHLPFTVADYVDFYSSRNHAENVGAIFRPDGDALTPNWLHLPIGYHGRSSTIVVSGTDIVRPSGQRRPASPGEQPPFGPSVRLDIEAEVGFVVGKPSQLGRAVPIGDFRDHVFGVVLVNDWSARDLQAWEYVPLGPFLGKSFATTISPWVVTLDALEAARLPGPVQEPEVLPYLQPTEDWGLDLAIEVEWNGQVVSRPPFSTMYWSPAQQLAHMTVNGATVSTGDLYASGTVSGTAKDERGSFLELSWSGTEPLEVAGEERTFLVDGDTIVFRATAPGADGTRIGFGECAGKILPAR